MLVFYETFNLVLRSAEEGSNFQNKLNWLIDFDVDRLVG